MSRTKYNRVGQVWADEHWVYYVLESSRGKKSKWWSHLCMRLNCDELSTILLCETYDRPWGDCWRKTRVA